MQGRIVSHYRVLDKLGQGGMGVVYRAEDVLLRRTVALKFLPDGAEHDALSIERFRREARTASALNHPHICTIHEIGEDEHGRPFIAMEFLEGENLAQVIAGKPLPFGEFIDLGMQIADGLAAAHAHGIIHRDLKPTNIYVIPGRQIKILDFGLAKPVRAPAVHLAEGSATLTAALATSPGVAAGTVAWMSPEQARGEELDQRSDLFSLGVVLYEMASGTLPFRGGTSAVMFDAILNRAPIPIAGAPPELSRVLDKALEKDRESRYQSAAEIRADLKRLNRDLSTTASAIPIPRTNPVRRRWAIAAGAMAIVLIATAYWVLGPTARPQITRTTQVTNDGLSKRFINRIRLATDGQRVYGTELVDGQLTPIQVAASGGDTSPIPNPFPNAMVRDFSPARPELLVTSNIANESAAPLFAVPIPAGSIRRLGDILASDATWSRDGATLLFTRGTAVYAADASGTNVRKIAEFPGYPSWPILSSDGKTVRLHSQVKSGTDTSIWQVQLDGTGLRSCSA